MNDPAIRSKPLEEGFSFAIGTAPVIDLSKSKRNHVYNEDIKLFYKKGTRIIFNQRWYFTLFPETDKIDTTGKQTFKDTPALYVDYPINTLYDKFIICLNVQGKVKVNKLFSVFNTFADLLKYHTYFKKEYLSFFEIILADKPRKMFFDLDAKDGTNLRPVLDHLLYSIYTVFSEIGINLKLDKDILIYCSHEKYYPETLPNYPNYVEWKPEGTYGKQSFHLIINNWVVDDVIEAKEMYNRTIEKIPELLRKYIDHSVYKGNQQFRMLGSNKLGSGRFKVLCEKYFFNNIIQTHTYNSIINENKDALQILRFQESLVTFTSYCKNVPRLIKAEHRGKTYKRRDEDYEEYELDKEAIDEAMQLMFNKLGEEAPFKISDVHGSMILLRRLRPSHCSICSTAAVERIHEHQNPFIYITYYGHTYFDCRRKFPDQADLFLGILTHKPWCKETPQENITAKLSSEQQTHLDAFLDRYQHIKLKPLSIKIDKKEVNIASTLAKNIIIEFKSEEPEKDEILPDNHMARIEYFLEKERQRNGITENFVKEQEAAKEKEEKDFKDYISKLRKNI